MNFEKSAQWQPLLKIIMRGLDDPQLRPILFVGAGLSAAAGYPVTTQVIEKLRNLSVRDMPDYLGPDGNRKTSEEESETNVTRDFSKWVELFGQRNGYGELYSALSKIFANQKRPSAIHTNLVALPWNSIYTTNYDELIEDAFKEMRLDYSLFVFEDNLGLHVSGVPIFKIHGSIHNFREAILDAQSYKKYTNNYPFLKKSLETELFKHSIVYVGCSMMDDRIVRWYEECLIRSQQSAQLRFSVAILPRKSWERIPKQTRELYKKCNLHPLLLDDHEELEPVSESLAKTTILYQGDSQKLAERVEKDSDLKSLIHRHLAPLLTDIIANIWLSRYSDKDILRLEDHIGEVVGAEFVSLAVAAFKLLESEVSEILEAIYKSDYDEQIKIQVTIAIIYLFKNNPPTRTQLKKVKNSPRELMMQLRPFAPRWFNQSHQTLHAMMYENLLRDLSYLIVDFCNSLPIGRKELLGNSFKDLNIFYRKTRELIKDYNKLYQSRVSHDSELDRSYRQEVIHMFNVVELFGADINREEVRSQNLSIAYISLNIRTIKKNPVELQHDLSIGDLLGTHNRLIIQGMAGQGKTTLLQWLAVSCAKQNFSGDYAHLNDKIPFVIKLREYSLQPLPRYSEFIGHTTPKIPVTDKEIYWTRQVLENGHGIIMVDGLDEVPQNQREEVGEWMSKLCGDFPKNMFVLTSRPPALKPSWFAQLNFSTVEMRPMSFENIRTFVRHWHQAASFSIAMEDTNTLEDMAEKCIGVIVRNKSLRKLSENPLICALICALHYARHGYLRGKKAEIYEAASRMLLDRRDLERKVKEKNPKFEEFAYEDKRVFLDSIAHWMMINQKTLINYGEINKLLEKHIQYVPTIDSDSINVVDLRQYLLERTGVLKEEAPNEISFSHKTFQEYFAAKEFIEEDSLAFLSSQAGNDQWNEVIELAVGLCSYKSGNRFVSSLLKKGDESLIRQERVLLYLLSMKCFFSLRKADPDLKDYLQRKLREFIPPKEQYYIDVVAAGGNLATSLLKRRQNYKHPREEIFSAYSLMRINTEDSYTMLYDYLRDRRPKYEEIISKLIPSMDRYTARQSGLVSLIMNKDSLRIPEKIIRALLELKIDIRILHDSRFKDLKELDFSAAEIDSLEPLNNTLALEKLNLGNTNIRKGHPIGKLHALVDLDISHTQLQAVEFLSELRKLRILHLRGLRVEDISPLANLFELRSLFLDGSSIFNLKPLAELKNLKVLSVRNCPITSLEPLKGLENLFVLCIDKHQSATLQVPEHIPKVMVPKDISEFHEIEDLLRLT